MGPWVDFYVVLPNKTGWVFR